MRWPILIAAMLVTGAANAQAVDVLPQSAPSQSAASTSTGQNDTGRAINVDRASLSSRAGPNAVGSDKAFGATIGGSIYTSIGRPIGSTIRPKR